MKFEAKRFAWFAVAATCAAAAFIASQRTEGVSAQDRQILDPSAWGGDHIGKRLPEYMTGGECLFCHRDDIGSTWQPNRHNAAMLGVIGEMPAVAALKASPTLAALAGEVTHLVGKDTLQRYLKPNGRYGQMSLLSTSWTPPGDRGDGRFNDADNPVWDENVFAESCAGCHATAVDMEYRGYSSISLDCFTCHGSVPEIHNLDTSLVYFAKKSEAGVQVEMSACAQCHLRGGKSESLGMPYPNQFVVGDNLFRDFQVDFSDEFIASLNPGERHMYASAKDVALYGNEE